MQTIAQEPTVAVGLLSSAELIEFRLHGEFALPDGTRWPADDYRIGPDSAALRLTPVDPQSSFTLRDVTIGVAFHWERKEDQQFQGALRLKPDQQGRLLAINEIGIEAYLTSVISSEMSASANPELLKAHAVIARSWLLAQLTPWKAARNASKPSPQISHNKGAQELIRWYDREDHAAFDICADDHCQRYQGVTKATQPRVFEAVRATYGQVLSYDGALCDARYSKSCGGMTEHYAAAWEDLDLPYLQATYDGAAFLAAVPQPLSDETNAAQWLRSAPPAFCNTKSRDILQRILPDFDQETVDFYRWRVTLAQDELQGLLQQKLGLDLGAIKALEPVERSVSGRLVRLRIVGEKGSLIIGKELEIRRALSPSHLYSSAFVVAAGALQAGAPKQFVLHGGGWGHGVGLCQIGAALMAEQGYEFPQILAHYYRGAELFPLYAAP